MVYPPLTTSPVNKQPVFREVLEQRLRPVMKFSSLSDPGFGANWFRVSSAHNFGGSV